MCLVILKGEAMTRLKLSVSFAFAFSKKGVSLDFTCDVTFESLYISDELIGN
jgi:hypothetical protein